MLKFEKAYFKEILLKNYKIIFLIFFIFCLNCSISNRKAIPFWEKNSYGEFEIFYFIGSNMGKAKGFLQISEDFISIKAIGPLNLLIFSTIIENEKIVFSFKNKKFFFNCSEISIDKFLLLLNGEKKSILPFFSCDGWDFNFDEEGKIIRINGPYGEVIYIYFFDEKPVRRFSFEYLNKEISINGKLKKIWKVL